jgi:hypothetical protein
MRDGSTNGPTQPPDLRPFSSLLLPGAAGVPFLAVISEKFAKKAETDYTLVPS